MKDQERKHNPGTLYKNMQKSMQQSTDIAAKCNRVHSNKFTFEKLILTATSFTAVKIKSKKSRQTSRRRREFLAAIKINSHLVNIRFDW